MPTSVPPSRADLTFVEGDGSASPPSASASSAIHTYSGRYSVLPLVESDGSFDGSFAPPSPPRLRYERGDLLGRGGMAEVVSARDVDIGRKIALKRLRPDRRQRDAMLRFIDEIRTVGRLEHPNIVPIHDVGVEDDGSWYFVMRLVPGESLAEIIERLAAGDPSTHARFGIEQRIRLFMEIAEAVAFAHQNGVLHRDLKPANVMVGPDGEVFVVDWGLARAIRQEGGSVAEGRGLETQAGTIVGTPLYMAPEQARGEPATERSEVYALGVLLHEMLYLKHYLKDKLDVPAVLAGVGSVEPSFASPTSQGPVPTEIMWILNDALKKDPSARIPDVATFLRRLRRRAEGDIEVHCPVTFMQHWNRRIARLLDRSPWLAVAMPCSALGFFVLGVVGWFV